MGRCSFYYALTRLCSDVHKKRISCMESEPEAYTEKKTILSLFINA